MNTLSRTASLACAVSAASIGTAFAAGASAPEDLFLELSEAPLSASELGEARGGFSVGGFDFNFSVVIQPVTVTHPFANGGPLPAGGIFGDKGGPLPAGGVFGDKGGPLPAGGVFGDKGGPLGTTLQPSAQSLAQAAADAGAAAAAYQPGSDAPVSPELASTTPASAPAASANASSPAATSLVAPVASESVSVSPPALVAAAPEPVATVTNAAPVVLSSAASPQAAETSQVAPIQVAASPAPVNTDASDSHTENAPMPAAAMPQSLADNKGNNGDEDPVHHGMSFTMVSADSLQRLQTVISNTRDGVTISRQISVNVTVANYAFRTGLERSASSLSRAVTQQVFLRGLN